MSNEKTNLTNIGKNLSTQEAAERLNCGLSTVTKLCRLRKIRAFKIGTDWRIPESSIHKFIEDQCNGR